MSTSITASITASIGDLALSSGGVLRDVELAYVTYGRLAADGRNAVLLTHGYTNNHWFADVDAPGSWFRLVGPGRAIDTDRYFVVSSNMLGSSDGSTAPRSIDPATGRPYGPDFPRITVEDIVAAQHRLLERLGVTELVAVVGPSYGGFQAFAWGVEYPDFMRGIAPVTTAPTVGGSIDVDGLRTRLAAVPGWNDGHYYPDDPNAPPPAAIVDAMTVIREATLRRYGVEALLADVLPAVSDRGAVLRAMAREWARSFDPHSLLVLGAAANELDVTPRLSRIRARVLYVLSSSDALFPPSLADIVMPALRAAGVDAIYHLLESRYGHLAPGADAPRWEDALGQFLRTLG